MTLVRSFSPSSYRPYFDTYMSNTFVSVLAYLPPSTMETGATHIKKKKKICVCNYTTSFLTIGSSGIRHGLSQINSTACTIICQYPTDTHAHTPHKIFF